ncbi:CRISPR-associated protein Cas4 [Leptolyngbya sp. PCC 6406]|uniref:CRISPR-associated protein Cas4 n=1 Tax=Leptolyngbya sp. PCC 6406 TaxID=1173264 RepID=UPI0002AD052E|nr:CRISPR-associated protein Cas4 [Leptolyngbya sp. PCC 6406]
MSDATKSPDDYLMISALQHMVFCPRQCALIHLEQVWEENLYTLRGQRVHEKVDVPEHELIEGIRVERAMPLWSHRLGLTGIADVVEFLADGTPYPVEYKSGSKKAREADDIQLCAQALCLEEMLGCAVPRGAIFHHASRRRREVVFDDGLRSHLRATIDDLRALLSQTALPPPVADNRCRDCSLLEACLPHALQGFANTARRNNPFAIADSAP